MEREKHKNASIGLLTAEQEVALATRIQAGDLSDPSSDAVKARNELVMANKRLAMHASKKFNGRGLPFMDLDQEAYLGLIRAADSYKPWLHGNARFAVCANIYIVQRITRAIADFAGEIRIPRKSRQNLMKWKDTEVAMAEEWGFRPSATEVSDRLGLSSRQHSHLMKFVDIGHVFRDSDVRSDHFMIPGTRTRKKSSLDFVVSRESVGCQVVNPDEIARMVRRKTRCLDGREKAVISRRYGARKDGNLTQEAIGKLMGCSASMVSHIEAKALEKLRTACLADPAIMQALRGGD